MKLYFVKATYFGRYKLCILTCDVSFFLVIQLEVFSFFLDFVISYLLNITTQEKTQHLLLKYSLYLKNYVTFTKESFICSSFSKFRGCKPKLLGILSTIV